MYPGAPSPTPGLAPATSIQRSHQWFSLTRKRVRCRARSLSAAKRTLSRSGTYDRQKTLPYAHHTYCCAPPKRMRTYAVSWSEYGTSSSQGKLIRGNGPAIFRRDASAAQGGDLGWFGPGRMVAPFEEAAFGARVNQVVGPIETQFGYHLIVVVARTENEVNIAGFRPGDRRECRHAQPDSGTVGRPPVLRGRNGKFLTRKLNVWV